MDFLEKLQRERYLILRSLRVAHAFLDRLEAGNEEHERLGELIGFLRHFAMDHFFAQEEALLEEWERRQAIQANLGELFLLRQEHDLGRAILASVAEQARRQAEERRQRQQEIQRQRQEQARKQREQQLRQAQATLCADLGKLITQVSRSLVRGQNALHTVEVRITRDPQSGVVKQLEARIQKDQTLEEKYRALLEELEARSGG